MRTERTGIQIVNPLNALKMKYAALIKIMNMRICVPELRASSMPIRATSNLPPGNVGIGSMSNQPTSVKNPAAKKNGWLQSRCSIESGEIVARNSIRNGAFARYGSPVKS